MPFSLQSVASRAPQAAAALLAAAALAGCQGIAPTQQFTQVRYIDASPDSPPLDVYQGTTPSLYGMSFGSVSSYIAVPPGSYTYAVDAAGSQQQLGQVRSSFGIGSQYTVLVGNLAASLQMTVLHDQATPTPTGQVALRILNQATRTGPLDLYLVPPGGRLLGTTPTLTAIGFDNAPIYTEIPAGAYTMIALSAGAVPTSSTLPLYTGNQINYPGASARTLLLLDQPATTVPSLQVVLASDYDSPAATN